MTQTNALSQHIHILETLFIVYFIELLLSKMITKSFGLTLSLATSAKFVIKCLKINYKLNCWTKWCITARL